MLESLLVRHGSPTLAGLKTGTLFTAAFSGQQEMLAALLYWNHRLSPSGLRLLPLDQRRGRTLIYFYRPSALAGDLRQSQVCALLHAKGYPCPDPDRCIVLLKRRLEQCRDFPHEVGLFLGYPVEDVRGFMEDPTSCKLAGCWKVYGDVQAARLLFAQFNACTRSYRQCLARGITLEQLAVPG